MREATYRPGDLVRCPALTRGGNPCRKPFGLAQSTLVVREAEPGDHAPLLHRCTACKTDLAVSLPATQAAA